VKHLLIVPVIFLFCGCEKKELAVQKYNRGDVVTSQVEMGPDYKRQVWFSLQDNKIVATNLKTDWDLAFEAYPEGYHLVLNGSKSMRAFRTSFNSLAQVTDTAGLGINGKADVPSGNLDSTAIGNWQTGNTVYVINLGYNELGQSQGFYKIRIGSVNAAQFTFEYAEISSGEVLSATVVKDAAYNFMYFSFSGKRIVSIEPEKTNYDLCFTQYTHLFLDPFQYYQVTGVLNNVAGTRVARINTKAFDEVRISDTAVVGFSTRRDAIGYDWKSFDLNTNVYTVNSKQVYLICDSRGFYYKLHFIDFYNASGIKGFPKFEFRKL
jgi:hypothetical protein